MTRAVTIRSIMSTSTESVSSVTAASVTVMQPPSYPGIVLEHS